jgi:hypothetical protein
MAHGFSPYRAAPGPEIVTFADKVEFKKVEIVAAPEKGSLVVRKPPPTSDA